MVAIRKWIDEKLIVPASTLNGYSIGWSVSVGFWGGIFPIPSMSTFATLALTSIIFGSIFTPAMTTIAVSINVAATPVQFFLLPFFMGLKSYIGYEDACSVSDLFESIRTKSIFETGAKFGVCMLCAVFFWALLAPFAILVTRLAISSLIRIKKNLD